MYNYKANSIHTIIPTTVRENYPRFEEFLKVYYEWQNKVTITINQPIGNFDIGCLLYSEDTQLTTPIESVVESNYSFITNFDDYNKRSFIHGENIFSYSLHSNPIEITINSKNQFEFNGFTQPNISLFRGETYYFENNTGYPFYIKYQKSSGSSHALSDVENNGASSGIISITITDSLQNLLYYDVSGISTEVGIFQIRDYTFNLIDFTIDRDDISILGIARVENILYHPEYLFHHYDDLTTLKSPDSFFMEYLSQYGLETFFKNNFKNRMAIQDFIRFFRTKGTDEAIKFFFKNFYGKTIGLSFPGELVLKPSEAKYFIYDQLFVTSTNKAIELTRNHRIYGKRTKATAIIESYQYNIGRNYYKLYLDQRKVIGQFEIGEEIVVIDDSNSSIEYDIESEVIGTVEKFHIQEPGEEYTIGETITNTYDVEGESIVISLNVSDITDTSIYFPVVEVPGSGYNVGDEIIFPSPKKKTLYYGKIEQSSTDTYNIKFTPQNTDLYELNYDGAFANFDGIEYTVISYDETENVLTLDNNYETPPVAVSGKLLYLTFPEQNVTDPFFDDEYFNPLTNATRIQARGYVASTDEFGGITTINMTTNGDGYIKKPSTTSGSVHVITESGNGSNITVSGQGFGGVLEVTPVNDILGIKYDLTITLKRGVEATDKDAKIRLKSGPTSEYGKFFQNNKSFLSDKIYIHDSYYYQDFSYVIKSDLNFSEFAELYRKLAHPLGFIFFNQYYIINYFIEKINAGADVLTTKKYTLNIMKKMIGSLGINFNLQTLTNVTKVLVRYITKRYNKLFFWRSSSLLDFWNEHNLTYSGATISGYEDEVLLEDNLLTRTLDESPISHYRTINIETTVSGTGTISYSDSTTSGTMSEQPVVVTGSGTLFTTETGPNDIILTESESLLVNTIHTDNELVAHRINTTISGITESSNVIDSNFEIYQKSKTELYNSNTYDIIQLGDNRTLGDITISGIQVQDMNTIFLT